MQPLSMQKFDMVYRGVCDGECEGSCSCETVLPELKGISALDVLETIQSKDFSIDSLFRHGTRKRVKPNRIIDCIDEMVKSARNKGRKGV